MRSLHVAQPLSAVPLASKGQATPPACYTYAGCTCLACAVLAYQVTLGELIVVILFWGTEANDNDVFTQLWASMIASVARLAVVIISGLAFSRALLPEYLQESQRKPYPLWASGCVGRLLYAVLWIVPFGSNVYEFIMWLTTGAETSGWVLVLRQTATPLEEDRPDRPKKKAGGASSLDRIAHEDVASRQERAGSRVSPEPGWWSAWTCLLISDPRADQFCSDLLRRVPPAMCYAEDGAVKYKLVGYRKSRLFGRRKVCTLVWKQWQIGCPQPLDPPPRSEGSDARERLPVDGFELLECRGWGCASGVRIDKACILGLRRCSGDAPGLMACAFA